ncbi:nucleic acid-binding, OB-fold-like protein [Actinidia rufa]|uniref:Nucleic acid-binding, OB-fold-like protein n=1 Tax=Actinidia rufa TaxID=165716 RepID=A0A7J0F0X5_9ERIC|nr:nucleic acid-binding, OB-fold-like protein [Actinidia rufa]
MPKNKGKGGKNRKRGKNEADDEKRELVFKEDGQEYAQVLRMLGNGRCEAACIDGTKRLCHIRARCTRRCGSPPETSSLSASGDYQDDKADVILKYMPDEARLLKAYGNCRRILGLMRGSQGGLMRKTMAAPTITSSSRTRTSIRSRVCERSLFVLRLNL